MEGMAGSGMLSSGSPLQLDPKTPRGRRRQMRTPPPVIPTRLFGSGPVPDGYLLSADRSCRKASVLPAKIYQEYDKSMFEGPSDELLGVEEEGNGGIGQSGIVSSGVDQSGIVQGIEEEQDDVGAGQLGSAAIDIPGSGRQATGSLRHDFIFGGFSNSPEKE